MRSHNAIFLTIILVLMACQPARGLSEPPLPKVRAQETQALSPLLALPTVTPLLGGALPTPMGSLQIPTLAVESLPTVPHATFDPTQAGISSTVLASKTPVTVTPSPLGAAQQLDSNGTGASSNITQDFVVHVPNPDGVICTETPWFYEHVDVTACPVEHEVEGYATLQRFEIGYMVWLSFNNKIYVIYHTAETPRWSSYDDVWQEGMPERDDSWYTRENQPPQTWQPRRGFGEIWRRFEDVRYRIGWAVQEWETPYMSRFQAGQDGSMMFQDPYNNIFYLQARGEDWGLYRPR